MAIRVADHHRQAHRHHLIGLADHGCERLIVKLTLFRLFVSNCDMTWDDLTSTKFKLRSSTNIVVYGLARCCSTSLTAGY